MSFFDSIPQPPPAPAPVRRPRPAWEQPDAVIPGSVPGELMLVRTGQAALTIGSIRAYPNGFEFTAHVRVRGVNEDEPVWHDPFDRHGRRGSQAASDVLRLGVLYADGRRTATSARYSQPDEKADPGCLVLRHGGGGGNARLWDGEFWVHPLPPDGPVTFVASWLEYGVDETRAQLDGSAIREAAGRAVILWPEEPEPGPGGAWSSQRVTASEPDDPGPRTDPGRMRPPGPSAVTC
jgi:hypothetical protein